MTGAFIFITLGVLILLNNLFPAQFGFERTWPVILIVIGVVKIVEHLGRSLPRSRRDRERPASPSIASRRSSSIRDKMPDETRDHVPREDREGA